MAANVVMMRGRVVGALTASVAMLAVAQVWPGGAVSYETVVVDPSGRPISGAFAFLHGASEGALAGAEGRVLIEAPGAEDVLTVAADGYLPRLFAVGTGLAGPPSRVVLERSVADGPAIVTEQTLPLGFAFRQARVLDSDNSLRFHWTVPPKVSRGSVNISWTDQGFTMFADLVHPSSGARLGILAGDTRIDEAVPGGMLRDHPGAYELIIQVQDGVARNAEVTARLNLSTGAWRAKAIEGRPPEVHDGTGDLPYLVPKNENMDLLDAWFTNETTDQVEIVIRLATLTTLTPQNADVAFWFLEWIGNGPVSHFVALKSEREGPEIPGVDEARGGYLGVLGTCDAELCSIANVIPATIEWGRPGHIRFQVPKNLAGAPADDTRATGPVALTFESNAQYPLFRSQMLIGLQDNASGNRAYTWGPDQYSVPRVVVSMLQTRSSPATTTTQWWAVPVVGLVIGASYLAVRMRPGSGEDPYVVTRVLGEGAHGRTYLAMDRRRRAEVCLKEVRHPTPESRERMLREARIAATLHHPHVVGVHGVEERTSGVRIIMEFVAGGSLEDRLRQGKPPTDVALRILAGVLAGLAAIHNAGIVHRDVKPSNILLTAEGRAKLADFGVACSVTEETLGGTGPVGTPLYMAPEVLRGHDPTIASDLYSAAAVGYRMLAGRPHLDIEGSDAWSVLVRRRGQKPVRPVKDLPAWLNELLARGLAEDPRKRPKSAAEMLAILEPHLPKDRAGQATSSLPPP